MQPMMMPLPELHPFQSDPEPAPVLRPRYFFAFKPCFHIFRCFFECLTVCDRAALLAGIGVDAVFTVAARPVSVTLGFSGVCDLALDTDLSVQLVPVEIGTRTRVGFQGLSLARLTVGKKNHSVAVITTTENQTDTRLTIGVHCGHTHSVRVRDCGHFFCCVEPSFKRLHGI